MQIEAVDATDDARFSEAFAPVVASQRDTWPGDRGWSEQEMRSFLRHQLETEHLVLLARSDDGSAAGMGVVGMPLRDNLQTAQLEVDVDPARRGCGIGKALLERCERIATERGRTCLIVRTEGRGDVEASRSSRFARAAGYAPALRQARRDLDLPVPAGLADELERQSLPHAAGYRVVTWTGRCPDALVAGRCSLGRSISTDAPRGELDIEGELWDEERLRNWEASIEGMGRALLCAGAVDEATGALVGFTEVGAPRAGEDLALQFATVVAPEARGHRLGMLVKLANLRQLAELEPATTRVMTFNALENDPMISLNDAMGFRVVGGTIAWQKLVG